jgi:hypothetical protein
VQERGTARFDEGKMLRVVHNLARNATEAMGPGGGKFVIKVTRDKADRALVVSFSDTGPGIPKDIEHRLFQSFVTSGKKGGTGLGLAIVKKIAEEHGGTISVQSSSRGATFKLRIPQPSGRWWLVGPLAWTCSDDADLKPTDAQSPERQTDDLGLSLRYFFVAPAGTSAYASLESAREGTSDHELEGGWAVGVAEQRPADGQRWGRTSKGVWLAMQDLAPARPSAFGGIAVVEGRLDFAWVVADRAKVWSDDRPKGKPVGERARFEVVTVREDRGPMARVGDGAWMLARDLARPVLASPPAEVAHPAERWIDVDTASQTLVAYEGVRPVYATLASTGRGPPETNVTPPGVHRIWVKMVMTDMDNVDREDVEEHYSMEDVPYVQFFDGAVALHGTYWHGDFGHARSHGCVNLAPLDARWLFSFTAPRLPAGWAAVYPTPLDPGTIVRVR